MTREARRHVRHAAVRRGVVVHDESGETFRCLIVDISIGGARLQLVAPNLPPGGLTLIDAAEGRSYALKPVWRAGAFVGVTFLSKADLPQ